MSNTQSHLIVKEEGIKIYKDDPASAILCEDQKWARKYICDHYTYIEKIGSIYPVPGIEFEPVEKTCKLDACWIYGKCQFEKRCESKTVARLIEHTAEKESPEIDKEEYRPTVATFEGHVLLLLQEFKKAHDEYQNNIGDTKVNPNGENTGYFRGKADAYGYAARQIRSMLRWHGKIDSDHPVNLKP